MAIEIITHRQDGGAVVEHREMGHGGIVLGVNVRFVTNPDGTTNADFLLMPCPICAAVSCHPISGGSSGFQNQMEFARLWQMRAQQLGIPPAQRGWASIKQMVCERVWALDGPERTCYILDAPPPTDIPQP